MQYCLIVLIHWEKSVIQPQKQVSEVSKTTFLPIKLQQFIIQAAMYAASELENELKKCGTTRISKVLKIRDMKLWVLSILIVSTIFVPIKRLKHFLSIVSMCCVDIQGSEYIHIEKQETDSKQ